jgi:hypothetical protein
MGYERPKATASMEIKVQCSCGSKFKFEIEPVNGRMPWAINCPSCGVDATSLANEVLAASGVQQSGGGPAPVALPRTVAAPVASRLRISHAPAPAAAVAAEQPESAGGGAALMAAEVLAPEGPSADTIEARARAITLTLLTVMVAGVVWALSKYDLVERFKTAAAVSAAGGTAKDAAAAIGPQNLWHENCTMLFVKHTNHLEIAEAWKNYWSTRVHKNLNLTTASLTIKKKGPDTKDGDLSDLSADADDADSPPGAKPRKPLEFGLAPARNGYVRILGPAEWPTNQFEGLAMELSQKFDTLVVEMNQARFSEEFHFGVYDQGKSKFHAHRHFEMINNEPYDITTCEGEEWATAHGFKPGSKGFAKFRLNHGDEITQELGIKLGEKTGGEVKFVVLKE